MPQRVKVAVLVGSLRKDSFTRKVAMALITIGQDPLDFDVIEIGRLPLYNQDDEANPPPSVIEFRQRVAPGA